MRKLILLPMVLICCLTVLVGQIPQGYNYQAVLRNDTSEEIPNASIVVKFKLISGVPTGPVVWDEEHNTTTNEIGVFNLIIGTGVRQDGTVANFSDIMWNTGDYYLKVSIYYENIWHDFSETKLVSVPFAKTAEKSLDNPFISNGNNIALIDKNFSVGSDDSGSSKVAIVSQDDLSDEALFEVRRADGQTVFAVYNDAVQINIPETPLVKGGRGGFSVGGFDRGKAIPDKFMVITSDSTRIYIDDSALKGTSRGGFAVGGFDRSKALRQDYLNVTKDSTRVYVENAAKGSKGGFSVGGFDRGKGPAENFFDITPENYFIGHKSGKYNLSGLYNSFVGYETGPTNSTGSSNALFGFQAGYTNTTGSSNLFLGYQSGYTNSDGSLNSFMGYLTGYSNTTGGQNTFLGSYSGWRNTIGSNNTFAGFNSGLSNVDGVANNFFGTGSGFSNTSGSYNTFIGPESGYFNTIGNTNTFIGYRAGYSNSANNNVFIGNECGYTNSTGTLNVFIGYAAGRSNSIGSGNVFMGNGAGYYNEDGESNIFIGQRAGFTNTSGNQNVYIGYQTGYQSTSAYSNVAIGHFSGYELTSAYQNVFVGESSGKQTTWGEGNVFVGNAAGLANVTGGSNVCIGTGSGQNANANNNTFVGWGTGYDNTSGGSNSFFGLQAGYNNTTGSNNVAIGNGAGYANQTGNSNVFIGRYAGWPETGSNKLYIDNSSTAAPLIYGDFSSNKLSINGDLGVGKLASGYKIDVAGKINLNSGMTGAAIAVNGAEALWYNDTYFSWGYGGSYNYFADKVTIGNTGSFGYALYVQGSAYTTGTWVGSDKRFKKDFESISDPLEKVLNMNGVTYLWRTDEYADKNFPEGRHYGVIAQEIELVLPEIVRETENGEKSVAYNELIPVLIEAVKEQQKTIMRQQQENDEMKTLLEQLQEDINSIKNMAGLSKN